MKEKLHQLLDDLHGELADTGSLDEQAKQELRALAAEIGTAVGEGEDGKPDEALGRLQAATLEFESEHPRIAGILGNIADTLAKLGI